MTGVLTNRSSPPFFKVSSGPLESPVKGVYWSGTEIERERNTAGRNYRRLTGVLDYLVKSLKTVVILLMSWRFGRRESDNRRTESSSDDCLPGLTWTQKTCVIVRCTTKKNPPPPVQVLYSVPSFDLLKCMCRSKDRKELLGPLDPSDLGLKELTLLTGLNSRVMWNGVRGREGCRDVTPTNGERSVTLRRCGHK